MRRPRQHDAAEDREIEHPGRGLADEVDLDIAATRREDDGSDKKEEIAADDHRKARPRETVVREKENDGGIDHEAVRERVGELPEPGLDTPVTREKAVHLIGRTRDAEDHAGGRAWRVPGADHQHDETRDQHEPHDRQRVRELRELRGYDASLHVSKDTGVPVSSFVNAHCHAFQRGLGARTEGADFWAWRETMLGLAAQQTPVTVRTTYAAVYAELRDAGYAAVGEFHYLGLAEAQAAAEAAEEAGIELVLLHVAYARGGIDRFRQESVAAYLRELEELRSEGVRVGVAPHSVRACPRNWLEELGRYAAEQKLPLHVHADEQPREIEECLAEHGMRPIELLDACGCLGPRTTVVHATHADGNELDLLAAAGARICACPTTEADLADGFLPVERILHRGIELCIGSDSNVRIDPREELRELDWIARRQSGRRDVFQPDDLLEIGSVNGARALDLEPGT